MMETIEALRGTAPTHDQPLSSEAGGTDSSVGGSVGSGCLSSERWVVGRKTLRTERCVVGLQL